MTFEDALKEVLYFEGLIKSKMAEIEILRKLDKKDKILYRSIKELRNNLLKYRAELKNLLVFIKNEPHKPVIVKEKPKVNDIILPEQEVITTTEETPRERLLRIKAEREKVNDGNI